MNEIQSEFEDRIEVPAIPERAELLERGQGITLYLEQVTVTDKMVYAEVDRIRTECVATEGIIKDLFTPAREFFHQKHKDVTAKQGEYLNLFESAESLAKKKLRAYDMEQERIAREEAERLRKEAEAILRAKQEKEAAELDAQGKTEEAVEVLDKPIPVVAAPEVKLTAASGKNYYKHAWKVRVVDPAKVPDQFKIVDEKALGAYARSFNGKKQPPNPVAGVEFYDEPSLIGGSR